MANWKKIERERKLIEWVRRCTVCTRCCWDRKQYRIRMLCKWKCWCHRQTHSYKLLDKPSWIRLNNRKDDMYLDLQILHCSNTCPTWMPHKHFYNQQLPVGFGHLILEVLLGNLFHFNSFFIVSGTLVISSVL